jgi:AraC-like DNA-binding protein
VSQLSTALRPSYNRLTLAEGGRFTAHHTGIDFENLGMQAAEESHRRVWEGTTSPERHAISFHIQPGPDLIVNGTEVNSSEIALHNSTNTTFCHRLSGPTHWGSMSLPKQYWVEIMATVAGRDLTPPVGTFKAAVPPLPLARLRRLHAAATHLSNHAPELIANVDARRGMENELVSAMVECLATPGLVTCAGANSTVAQRHHARIMRRVLRFLEESANNPVYVAEMCAAANASERNLRICCQEYLGMGPRRYLHLRRMHLARNELLRASKGDANITNIATQFGFWELGRFAVNYHSIFGESPSATLRRAT